MTVLNFQSRFLIWMELGYFGKECKFHKDSQPWDLSVPNTNLLFFYGIKKHVCMPMHCA
jgi:hypothetical protein